MWEDLHVIKAESNVKALMVIYYAISMRYHFNHLLLLFCNYLLNHMCNRGLILCVNSWMLWLTQMQFFLFSFFCWWSATAAAIPSSVIKVVRLVHGPLNCISLKTIQHLIAPLLHWSKNVISWKSADLTGRESVNQRNSMCHFDGCNSERMEVLIK